MSHLNESCTIYMSHVTTPQKFSQGARWKSSDMTTQMAMIQRDMTHSHGT